MPCRQHRPAGHCAALSSVAGAGALIAPLALVLFVPHVAVAQQDDGRRSIRFAPMDNPRFCRAEELTSSLIGTEVVLGLDVDGVQRAYPVRYMKFHHLCHDEVNEVAILVSYCELCRSGIAYDRQVEQEGRRVTLHFDIGGLTNGYMAMVDRETQSRWPHITGRATDGALRGKRLKSISLTTTTWDQWVNLYPQTQVLLPDETLQDTGVYRVIDAEEGNSGSRFVANVDTRQSPDSLGLGVWSGSTQYFFGYDDLARSRGGVLESELDGTPIVILFDPIHRSARCFSRELNGRTVAFASDQPDAARFQTVDGSTFDLLGRCTMGPDAPQRLTPVENALTVRWYGWSATYPGTEVYRPGP